jgi:hypothetical protein
MSGRQVVHRSGCVASADLNAIALADRRRYGVLRSACGAADLNATVLADRRRRHGVLRSACGDSTDLDAIALADCRRRRRSRDGVLRSARCVSSDLNAIALAGQRRRRRRRWTGGVLAVGHADGRGGRVRRRRRRQALHDARRAASRAEVTDLSEVLPIRATKPHRQARRSNEQRRRTHGFGAPALSLAAALAPSLTWNRALKQQYQQGSTVSTHSRGSVHTYRGESITY